VIWWILLDFEDFEAMLDVHGFEDGNEFW